MDTDAVVTLNCAIARRSQMSSYKMLQNPETKKNRKYHIIRITLYHVIGGVDSFQEHQLQQLERSESFPDFSFASFKNAILAPRNLANGNAARRKYPPCMQILWVRSRTAWHPSKANWNSNRHRLSWQASADISLLFWTYDKEDQAELGKSYQDLIVSIPSL